jgi:hypothetical protein
MAFPFSTSFALPARPARPVGGADDIAVGGLAEPENFSGGINVTMN